MPAAIPGARRELCRGSRWRDGGGIDALLFFWFLEGVVLGAFWKPLGVLGRPLVSLGCHLGVDAFLESREVVLGPLVRLGVFRASQWALGLSLGALEAISGIFQEILGALHVGVMFGILLRSEIESEIALVY